MIITVEGWVSALGETMIVIFNVGGSVSGDDKGRDLDPRGGDYRWIDMKEAVYRAFYHHRRLGMGGDP